MRASAQQLNADFSILTASYAMPAGHFVYIPAILLFGLVAGWILGSRAAADAYAAELRRREERAAKKQAQQNPKV